jgi:hypothetical protein
MKKQSRKVKRELAKKLEKENQANPVIKSTEKESKTIETPRFILELVRIFKYSIVYYLFAIIILSCYVAVHYLKPELWFEIIITGAVLSIALFITDNFFRNKSGVELLESVIIFCGALNFAHIAYYYNANNNYIDIGIIVISILVAEYLFLISFKASKKWGGNSYNKKSIVLTNILLGIIITVLTVLEIYVNLGTQFIWLPIISFVFFMYYFTQDKDIYQELCNKFPKINEPWSIVAYIDLTFIAIAILSTVYQFWFSPILFGIKLWGIFLGIVILYIAYVIIITLYIKIIKIIENRKEEKKQKAIEAERVEALRIKEENREKQLEEENRELNSSIRAIQTARGTRSDFVILANYKHHFPTVDYSSMHVPLTSFIQISDIKKQIIWDKDLKDVLKYLDRLMELSYQDYGIRIVLDQIDAFLGLVANYKDYRGAETLNQWFKENCPTIYKMIKTKNYGKD